MTQRSKLISQMAQRSSSTYGTKPNGIKPNNTYDSKVKYLKWHKGQVAHMAQRSSSTYGTKPNGIKAKQHLWHKG